MSLSIKRKKQLLERYGPWAIVTGASSGIGKATAAELASCGFNLLITSRSEKVLNELSDNLIINHGIDVRVVAADISCDAEKIIEVAHDLDVGLIINSAGFGTSGPVTSNALKKELNMLQVNVEALFKLTHHFACKFKEAGKGGIVLLSSAGGFQGMPLLSHYAATKAYVQSLGEGLYYELKPHNVDVLTISPGPVKTSFAERANMKMMFTISPQTVVKDILGNLGKRPMVISGTLVKVLMAAVYLPRLIRVKLMKIITKRMVKGNFEDV